MKHRKLKAIYLGLHNGIATWRCKSCKTIFQRGDRRTVAFCNGDERFYPEWDLEKEVKCMKNSRRNLKCEEVKN